MSERRLELLQTSQKKMSSDQRWRFLRPTIFSLFFSFLLPHNLMFRHCFSTEALALMKFKERIEKDPFGALMNWGELSHCSWSGVVCSHGRVVILNLQDLSLQGTLAPELGNLTHLKSLILRNNSFSGKVPKEVTELQELEILDLCDNSFGQPFPFSRRLLQITPPAGFDAVSPPPPPPPLRKSSIGIISPPPPSPPLTVEKTPPTGTPSQNRSPAQAPSVRPPSAHPPPPPPPRRQPSVPQSAANNEPHKMLIIVGVVVAVLVVLAALVTFFLLRNKKVKLIMPWASGSSGQLQSVVISGVPKLKLSELETACEGFSNIIGSTSSDATIYKGTLSTGSEIAVLSVASGSLQDWSVDLETQFQEKIQRLSQVDHKNFLNIIGYCHEDEPFTRMVVFEYVPNGSLSEHLYEQDSEHLDWSKRVRIVMGIAYCVEHMHNLNPKPIFHTNLNSSSIYLTLDYAAKVADFTVLSSTPLDPMSNIFSFGVILHEIITGKVPDTDTLLQETRPVTDPSLKSFEEEVVQKLWGVVKECLNENVNQRPEMREVVVKLTEITGITAEAALPRLSPGWWAELEIISTEAN